MQTPQLTDKTTASESTVPIGMEILDGVCARIAPVGLSLVIFRPDGTVAFPTQSYDAFFARYVAPQFGWTDGTALALTDEVQRLHAASPLRVWETSTGIAIALFPFVEKRQVIAGVALVARGETFGNTEELQRACGRLQLDVSWLLAEAGQLPTYGVEALQRQARLIVSMLRDQKRLTGLEEELNSLSGQLANTYEELSLIYQISSGMKVNRRAAEFFRQACHEVRDVMGVRSMGVALDSNAFPDDKPVLYGQTNLTPDKLSAISADLLARLREKKAPLLINDLGNDRQFAWIAGDATQMLAVPLQRQEQVLGALFVFDKLTGDFDSVDSKLLTSIANESAIYLENAMLFDDVHGLMMGLLHSLTSAVDAKDAYTCGHSERVALLSRNLALSAGLNDHQVERVYMAGLLHDVGKIGVPESVLQKTGKLTAQEFEQIKKHPEIGARILRDIKQIEDIIPGVMHHHERFDGRGYPNNLAGEQIPLMGRIICLADCFDAMTSSRTYRKALPLEVALTEIRRCSGTQFDPVLADAFLRIGADRFRQILAEHQGQAKRLVELQETLRAG